MLFIEHYFEHDDLLLLLPCVSTLTNALFGEKKSVYACCNKYIFETGMFFEQIFEVLLSQWIR